MFRDTRQQAEVCMALCERARLRGYFTDQGPTEKAVKALDGSPLSHGEHVMLRVAWSFWNDNAAPVTVGEMLATLDRGNLEAVASLLLAAAQGSLGYDRWLERHRARL